MTDREYKDGDLRWVRLNSFQERTVAKFLSGAFFIPGIRKRFAPESFYEIGPEIVPPKDEPKAMTDLIIGDIVTIPTGEKSERHKQWIVKGLDGSAIWLLSVDSADEAFLGYRQYKWTGVGNCKRHEPTPEPKEGEHYWLTCKNTSEPFIGRRSGCGWYNTSGLRGYSFVMDSEIDGLTIGPRIDMPEELKGRG